MSFAVTHGSRLRLTHSTQRAGVADAGPLSVLIFTVPVGAAEHRSPFAMKRASCLSCSSGAGVAGAERTASQASAQKGEERKEPRAAGQAVGVPFSLVTFSWASKRK